MLKNTRIAKYKYILKYIPVGLLLVTPIIVVNLPILLSGVQLPSGDFDMQVQMTEAAKISILDYNQFPFWNPWVSGGVPLFGDPQFGLVTPPTLLSLFMNTVIAWKISIVLYMVIGFFGFLALLNHISKKYFVFNVFISYIWIFGSFFQLRALGGHFTFLLLALLPLVILYGLKPKSARNFIILTIILAYIFNASIHYSTILIIVVGIGFVLLTKLFEYLIEIAKKGIEVDWKNGLKMLLHNILYVVSALFLAVALNSWRIYLSIEYIRDGGINRALGGYEKFIGLENALHSLFTPYQRFFAPPGQLNFGSFETSNYIGRLTLFTAIILIIIYIYLLIRKKIVLKNKELITLFPTIIFISGSFLVGVGGVFFWILRTLPVFSSTRVSTRWLFISTFFLLMLISILLTKIYRSKYKVKYAITFLLIITSLEVFIFNYSLGVTFWQQNGNLFTTNSSKNKDTAIDQEILWNTKDSLNYFALTEATINNKGQIIADNALVDTRILPSSLCDQDEHNCSYVKSNNARILSWTPNFILVERTGPGKIVLNGNSGVHWMVNGVYLFSNTKTVNTDIPITFGEDEEKIYSVRYVPLPKVLK